MKKTLLFVIVSATALLLIMSGCSKKDSGSQAATMKNVSGTYKLTALTGAFGGLTFNLYDSLKACQKDDNLKFNVDSSYQYIDAGTQCDTSGNSQGTWYISNSYLIMDDVDTFTIKSFTGSQLVLNYTDYTFGVPLVTSETLTKL